MTSAVSAVVVSIVDVPASAATQAQIRAGRLVWHRLLSGILDQSGTASDKVQIDQGNAKRNRGTRDVEAGWCPRGGSPQG